MRALESAETAMSSQLWSTAAASLLNVINMHPNCTIAMYRAALCILASDGDCYLPDVPNKAMCVSCLICATYFT